MSKRERRLKLSVILNLGLRVIGIFIGILVVPVLLGFLGKEKYGIWITVSVVVHWLNVFDIGLGQGLKLKLTEAFSKNKINLIKKLISSTYILVLLISITLLIVVVGINFIVPWSDVLNLNKLYSEEIDTSINVLVSFFLLIFVLKLIGVIYSSLQLPFVDNVVKTVSQIFFLSLILCFNQLGYEANLIIVSLFSMLPLFLVYLGLNLYFFRVKTPSLFPKIKNLSLVVVKEIVSPSVSFFIIQLGCIVLYTSDNLIILKLLSASDVSKYSVYYKYYSFPFIFYNIYIASHWSSFIDALSNNDFLWIRKKIIFFLKMFLLLVLCYITLFVFQDKIMNFWLGDNNFEEDRVLSLYMILYFLISSFTTIFIYVVNSVGNLRVQLVAYVFIGILNIPLSVIFVNYFDMGGEGVIFASAVCLSLLLVLMPIQSVKILKGKANGIWAK